MIHTYWIDRQDGRHYHKENCQMVKDPKFHYEPITRTKPRKVDREWMLTRIREGGKYYIACPACYGKRRGQTIKTDLAKRRLWKRHMTKQRKNHIWFIVGLILGIGAFGYGIALKYLEPTQGDFNLRTFAFVAMGGFLIVLSWFARNFIDED